VHFADRLAGAVKQRGNPVLVGIDPRVDLLPDGWLRGDPRSLGVMAEGVGRFGVAVLDVVADMVPAVKFQAAFYERLGPPGLVALGQTMAEARRRGLIVILDGKRNDIGTTAEAYAEAYLGSAAACSGETPWAADAMTVNPYLGSDGIVPFVKVAAQHGNGVFALVRTSNPSARDFQDLICSGQPLYRHVAARLGEWAAPQRNAGGYSLLGAVVGATYPEELAELRALLPGIWFLVPGYGSQGGTAADVAAAFDGNGLGAIVNNSRGIVFAYRQAAFSERIGADWQRAIEEATRSMIADLADRTSAGRLWRSGDS
jgi:orotidine-5'-phosphate decarboxylase